MMIPRPLIFFLLFVLSSCSTPRSSPPTADLTPTVQRLTATPLPKPTRTVAILPLLPTTTLSPTAEQQVSPPVSADYASPTPLDPTPTFAPKAWRELPVIPQQVSEQMRLIYEQGQAVGNNPHAFSKVGDCQSTLPMFLGYLDEGRYDLGAYTQLEPVINQFSGSFGRNSRAVKDGLTASGVNASLWNDWRDCQANETPLACEYRLHNPSFVFISLGTNDANGFLPFEQTLRAVIDYTLAQGIVPILVTKADNAEGDYSINLIISRLAYEYQIPLWNFWLAVQDLPLQGLRSPEHLTYGEYVLTTDFSNPTVMQYAFNVRNLNALQVLDLVWRSVTGEWIGR